MWPFSRRRAEPETISVDDIAPARLPFILLQVRDDRPEQVTARLATAHAIVIERNGVVSDIMSSLSLSVFGFPDSAGLETDRANHASAVEDLMRNLSPDVRLLHGIVDGLIGNTGSELRMHYGPVIPRFADYLQTLMKLEFGEAREFST